MDERSPMGYFMTATDLARLLGVSDRRVRKMAENREIGQKFGHIWVFSHQEVQELLIERKRSTDWRVKKPELANV
jgi:excisionase family DNA binding protein